MATIARRTFKTILFIALAMIIGRLVDPSGLVGDENTISLAKKIYGEANAENIYDVQFYINFPVILILTIIVYLIVMKGWRHFRK